MITGTIKVKFETGNELTIPTKETMNAKEAIAFFELNRKAISSLCKDSPMFETNDEKQGPAILNRGKHRTEDENLILAEKVNQQRARGVSDSNISVSLGKFKGFVSYLALKGIVQKRTDFDNENGVKK